MTSPLPPTEVARGPWLSIGALSRATGIPTETLRTWEARYGFPTPERKPSGHRLYDVVIAARLRRVAEALAQGHRASQVVPADESELARILSTTARAQPSRPAPASAAPSIDHLMAFVAHSDRAGLYANLQSAWSRATPLGFCETVVLPLLTAVGEAWAAKRLQVRHEHLVTECVGDFLRSARLPYDERARGPLALLTTLPGEQHGLGIHMAALVLACSNWRALPLGTQTPVGEIAAMATDLRAELVAVSVSSSSAGRKTASHLTALRRKLPRRIHLVSGGAGAPESMKGVQRFETLTQLKEWAEARASDTTNGSASRE